MESKRQISCVEFQIISVDTAPPLKAMELNSLPFKCGLHIVTSFQRVQHRKGGGNSNFIVENLTKILSKPGDQV